MEIDTRIASSRNIKTPSAKFIIVFYIILRSGVVFIMTQDRFFNYLDACFMVFLFFVILTERRRLNSGQIVALCFIVAGILFAQLIHNDPAYNTNISLILNLCLTFLVANIVDFDDFKKHFIRIIIVLASLSLALFLLQPLLYGDYSKAPIIVIQDTAHYYNLWVWVSRLEQPARNSGVFWEPGAYQVFLNLALLFVMLDKTLKRQYQILLAIILTITIFTTYSTTGYIVCALVYLATVAANMTKLSPRNLAVGTSGLLLLAGVSVILINNETIVGKFGVNNPNYGSFQDRYNATQLDIQLMNDHILFGVGFGDYLQERVTDSYQTGTYAITTPNTYSIIGASLGIFALVFYSIQHLKLTWNLRSSLASFFLISLVIILLFSTENFLYFKLPHILFWYGFMMNSKTLPLVKS